MKFTVPINLPSLPNTRMSWQRLARLKRAQRAATRLSLLDAVNRGQALPSLPVQVTITRVGPRMLDGDNLQAAAKYVRDQVAEEYGADDGSASYEWRYAQRRGPRGYVAVEIEILFLPSPP